MSGGGDVYDPNDEAYRECSVCNSEFDGACPVNSSDCPFLHQPAEDEEEEEEEDLAVDEMEDFDDIEDLEDKEAAEDDFALFEGDFDD